MIMGTATKTVLMDPPPAVLVRTTLDTARPTAEATKTAVTTTDTATGTADTEVMAVTGVTDTAATTATATVAPTIKQ